MYMYMYVSIVQVLASLVITPILVLQCFIPLILLDVVTNIHEVLCCLVLCPLNRESLILIVQHFLADRSLLQQVFCLLLPMESCLGHLVSYLW